VQLSALAEGNQTVPRGVRPAAKAGLVTKVAVPAVLLSPKDHYAASRVLHGSAFAFEGRISGRCAIGKAYDAALIVDASDRCALQCEGGITARRGGAGKDHTTFERILIGWLNHKVLSDSGIVGNPADEGKRLERPSRYRERTGGGIEHNLINVDVGAEGNIGNTG